jgi:hypothetical protein
MALRHAEAKDLSAYIADQHRWLGGTIRVAQAGKFNGPAKQIERDLNHWLDFKLDGCSAKLGEST